LVVAGQNNTLVAYDGVSPTYYTLPGGCSVRDVSLLQKDLGYAAVKCASDARVYKFNGFNWTLDYTITDAAIVPTGIAISTPNNVWMTTLDPSVFYKFDGRRWEYSNLGWSSLVSVVVNFGNLSTTGITDLSMSNSRTGYAVGSDGIILIFKSSAIDSNSNFNGTVNLSEVMNYLNVFNQSISTDVANINNIVSSMNTTMNYKLDNIVNNVTYSQLYMETTLYPVMNATYQNTLEILIRLGFLEAQINQTIQLQNDTLNIVNATDAKVDQLLNKSNRMRAWVTQ
jgi:hypothetical protein